MATQQPNYTAYTVIKRDGADDFWIAIGAAWMHQDGGGFSIMLQALPIPTGDGQCKIVLRPPKAQNEQTQEQPANTKRRETRRDK
jgi:hypothetical protein